MGISDKYECDGQMSLFGFMENKSWNPVEAYAGRGSGFCGGKDRIRNYFSENHSISERADFLKKSMALVGLDLLQKKNV